MSQISIVKLSEVEKDIRLDAEFNVWNKKFLIKSGVSGEDIIDFVQYGTSKDLNEENLGFPILRLNEFEGVFIGKPKKYTNLINKKTFESLNLKQEDVLICRTNGNPNLVGKSAICMADKKIGFASYLFRVRPKRTIINSSTLMIFLNSNYGRNEINKYSMTSNQTNFSPAKFRLIKIPLLPSSFQQKIETIVKDSYQKLQKSPLQNN